MKIIFNVYNPWSDTWANGYRTNHIVNVDFQFNPVGDHAGASIMLGLFGYDVELHFYDTRHWNYLTNTWESHE